MKQKITLSIFLLCFVAMSSFSQQIDKPKTATLNENYCLILPTDSPLSEKYVVDISSLNFQNEKEAQKTFGTKCNNLITYRSDFDNERVIVQLHLDRTGGVKDIAWWNTYLSRTCANY